MNKWAIVIGAGLALFPLHNKFLTDLTAREGVVFLFLPALGFILVMLGAFLFMLNHWQKVNESGLGNRKVYIPLSVIAFAVMLSGFAYDSINTRLAIMAVGIGLFVLYVVSRILGRDMFLPMAIGACIASVGVIIYAALFKVFPNGGFLFENNYDIVVGYVLLGIALMVHKWQWVLAGLALVAMFFSGSPEMFLPLGLIGVAMLIRKDWSKKVIKAIIPLIIVVAIWFSFGWGKQLYSYAWAIVQDELPATIVQDGLPASGDHEDVTGKGYGSLTYRLVVIKEAMTNITPFGEGYKMTWETGSPNVHNVPLVLIEQMGYAGIIAALAWLWVTIYCLVKTKWKYVWLLIISLSVFDHFIWSQMGLWWWVIVGVSTAGVLESDLLFKQIKQPKQLKEVI